MKITARLLGQTVLNIAKISGIPLISTAAGIASDWLPRFKRTRDADKHPLDEYLQDLPVGELIQGLVKHIKLQNPLMQDIDDNELAKLLEQSPEVAAVASEDPQILSEPERLESAWVKSNGC